jgi:hypothetical protein
MFSKIFRTGDLGHSQTRGAERALGKAELIVAGIR